MKKYILHYILLLLTLTVTSNAYAQAILSRDGDRMSPDGSVTQSSDRDSTSNHQIPRGLTVWTVDEITGAKYEAEPDTLSYLFMNSIFASGRHGEYNTLGNNGSPRLNRIFIDRDNSFDFPFVNSYSQVLVQPYDFHFTNTLSPITNLSFNECGDKVTGEDHLKVLFAVNANKRLGFGLKFDYLYARGYYANQNISHFNTTVWGSYNGDRYQAHLLFSTNHQKQTENGGIVNDEYIKHPELSSQNFSENEIPTVLERNWNINDNHHIFFTQRYSIGFNRRVPMTEKEKEAKQFAMASEKEKASREANKQNGIEDNDSKNGRRRKEVASAPTGRPDNAKIMGDEPSLKAENDTTRIAVNAEDIQNEASANEKKAEEDPFMKNEYVPVTSFFHTARIDFFRRLYRAYESPKGYYANDYFEWSSDSIEDRTRHTYIRNNFGIAMLEGFNKWAKAGINLYGAHEFRHYSLPLADRTFDCTNESSFILGGEIIKHEGKTLHFDARGEYYFSGTDAGQIFIDANADLNFPLFGDTVRLDANAFYHRIIPDTYFFKYSSRHFQWDTDLETESRYHIEGNLSLQRTETRLRLAIDDIENYTYLGTSYTLDNDLNHIGTTISPRQVGSVRIITAQLYQNLHYGILHWDNIITYQKTTKAVELPLPKLNIFSNLYLRFKIAKVLATDFGADVRFFTKYDAPEYSPALQSFVIQENEQIRTTVGNYPIVDAYFNFHLKNCRFFFMMSHVNCSGKGNYFLTPHYPLNSRVFRMGLSWNFFN